MQRNQDGTPTAEQPRASKHTPQVAALEALHNFAWAKVRLDGSAIGEYVQTPRGIRVFAKPLAEAYGSRDHRIFDTHTCLEREMLHKPPPNHVVAWQKALLGHRTYLA